MGATLASAKPSATCCWASAAVSFFGKQSCQGKPDLQPIFIGTFHGPFVSGHGLIAMAQHAQRVRSHEQDFVILSAEALGGFDRLHGLGRSARAAHRILPAAPESWGRWARPSARLVQSVGRFLDIYAAGTAHRRERCRWSEHSDSASGLTGTRLPREVSMARWR